MPLGTVKGNVEQTRTGSLSLECPPGGQFFGLYVLGTFFFGRAARHVGS